MKRGNKTFVGVLFVVIFLLGCGKNALSLDAAPLNEQASNRIEKNLDIEKFNAIAGSCTQKGDPVCLKKMAKEIERVFTSSGYSLNKTMANCYSNRDNAVATMQLGWGDLFLGVFVLLETPEGKEYLIKEKILSQETIDVLENAKKL